MQVYSNLFIHKETGDLLGYDLAIKRDGDSAVDALLYVYEGGDSDDGVPLSGQVSNNRLSIQGTWVEHLVQYPLEEGNRAKTLRGIRRHLGFRGVSGRTDHRRYERARASSVKARKENLVVQESEPVVSKLKMVKNRHYTH